MNISINVGISTWMIFGVSTSASPPLIDLPINQVLISGEHIDTNSTVIGRSWLYAPLFGNRTVMDINNTESLELTVGVNQTVTTPAGTFECVKLTAGSGIDLATYYYSDKVGNYVKASGAGSMGAGVGALGNLTLTSFSYGSSSGIMSFITGKYWWVTALIVVVVVVVIVSLVVMRKRGRTQPTAPPPVQQAPPPPG